MSKYYRCQTGADCQHAGKRWFPIENLDTWECPLERKDCKECLREIPWSERNQVLIRLVVIGGIIAVLLAAATLFWPDLLLKRATGFAKDCGRLETEASRLRLPTNSLKPLQESIEQLSLQVNTWDPSAPDARETAANLQRDITKAEQSLTPNDPTGGPWTADEVATTKQTLVDNGNLLRHEAEERKHVKALAAITEGQAALERVATLLNRFKLQESEGATAQRSTALKLTELQNLLSTKLAALEEDAKRNAAWLKLPVKLTILAQPSLARRLLGPLAESFARQRWSTSTVSRKQIPGKEEWRITVEGNETGLSIVVASIPDKDLFSGLSDHVGDIAATARQPTAAEIAKLAVMGDMTSPSCAQVIALDGIALLLHPSAPDTVLSPQEVAQLLAGQKVRGFSAIFIPHQNGDEGHIRCGLPRAPSPEVSVSPQTQTVSDSIIASPAAIGFAAYSVPPRAKLAAVQTVPDARPLKPSPFTIATEDYKFSQRIIAYHAMKPPSKFVHDFMNYVISVQGQTDVGKLGFVDQNLKAVGADIPNEMLVKMAKALGVSEVKNAKRLSTNLRFDTAKAELDLKGSADIDRLVRKLAEPELRDKSIVLAGFADKRGGDMVNVPLSDSRADYVRLQLQQRNVGGGKQMVSVGFSSAYPVDDSDTAEGLQKNRRVEIWVVDVVR